MECKYFYYASQELPAALLLRYKIGIYVDTLPRRELDTIPRLHRFASQVQSTPAGTRARHTLLASPLRGSSCGLVYIAGQPLYTCKLHRPRITILHDSPFFQRMVNQTSIFQQQFPIALCIIFITSMLTTFVLENAPNVSQTKGQTFSRTTRPTFSRTKGRNPAATYIDDGYAWGYKETTLRQLLLELSGVGILASSVFP